MAKKKFEPEYDETADLSDPLAGDETAADQAEAAKPVAEGADEALAALQKERDSFKDQFLRAVADFDNYRKRIERERRELSEYAAADVLRELLPIIDNLERALNAPASGDIEGVRKGVELIHQQMVDLLRKRGVTPIEAVGADFDPRYHQAVVQEHSPDHRDGEVLEEFTRGYMLGDRLLRPAMVKVAKA